jgi:hypothetical protein
MVTALLGVLLAFVTGFVLTGLNRIEFPSTNDDLRGRPGEQTHATFEAPGFCADVSWPAGNWSTVASARCRDGGSSSRPARLLPRAPSVAPSPACRARPTSADTVSMPPPRRALAKTLEVDRLVASSIAHA